LLCDGSAHSRTTEAALFAVIGTLYGAGDGTTTFNLPDGRGRSLIGAGQGTGLTNRALAAKGGEETHQLILAELASHAHTQPAHSHTVNSMWQAGAPYTAGPTAFLFGAGATTFVPGTTAVAPAINPSGGDTPHNTMPPFLVVNYIIKN
jgi:microcystin-dependent protein